MHSLRSLLCYSLSFIHTQKWDKIFVGLRINLALWSAMDNLDLSISIAQRDAGMALVRM